MPASEVFLLSLRVVGALLLSAGLVVMIVLAQIAETRAKLKAQLMEALSR